MARTPKPPHAKQRAARASARAPAKAPAAAASRPTRPGPQPPDYLTKDEREVWDEIAHELFGLRFLAQIDVHVFARYCHHVAEWRRLVRKIRREGESRREETTFSTPEHPKYMTRLHPMFKRLDRHEEECLKLEDRFGMSALSRYRLIAQSAARPGAFSDLFGTAAAAPANDQAKGQPSGEAAPVPAGGATPFGFLKAGRPN